MLPSKTCAQCGYRYNQVTSILDQVTPLNVSFLNLPCTNLERKSEIEKICDEYEMRSKIINTTK